MGLLVFHRHFLKPMKRIFMTKCTTILILLFQSGNVAFGKYTCNTCILAMIENCRKSIDNDRVRGVVMTNLSKAFEWIMLQHMILRAQD